MSRDAAARHLNVDTSDPVLLLNRNAAFGFDAEVAADTAGMDAGAGPSPPIAVPTNKATHSRQHLSVEVGYEPLEFRTVSPQTIWDQGNSESATDSPIGGGLMYVQSLLAFILQFPNSTFPPLALPPPRLILLHGTKNSAQPDADAGCTTRAFPSMSLPAASIPLAAFALRACVRMPLPLQRVDCLLSG
jgi:hypothetical protein